MKAVLTLLALLALAPFSAPQEETRAIVPEAFLKARPATTKPAGTRPATYRPVDPPPARSRDSLDLGVTVWRLRPARAGEPVRLLVQDPERPARQYTPERIAAGTPLADGDRVRISIESPRTGFLYVFDREQYADGSVGDPFLVFPTKRTRGGDNRVQGGRLIDIPAQDDRPPYFTVKPSRADQIGERLTLAVSDTPLAGVTVGAEAAPLPPALVADLEKRGTGSVQRLEMVGGAGRTWSRAEQQAAADATRLLTQADPPPQTLFRVVVTAPDLVVVHVTLPQSRGRVTR